MKGLKNVASIICNVDGMNGSYYISNGSCTASVAPIYVEARKGGDVIRGSFSAFCIRISRHTFRQRGNDEITTCEGR